MNKYTFIIILLITSVANAGSLLVWGNCESGACGVDDPNEPPVDGLPFPEGNDFIDIALGGGNGFALRENGEILGWGYYNSFGTLDIP